MNQALAGIMSVMRARTVFPSDWNRVNAEKLYRLVAEVDRGRLHADRNACR